MGDADETKGGEMLRRVLGLITEVRPGEALVALLLTLDGFVLLTAYYLIKPVREGLILATEAGAEYKSYASAAIAVLLLAVVPLYGRLSRRFRRHRLVFVVTFFFATNLVGFWALDRIDAIRPWLGIPFYLWVGIFNMMVVAQLWAFASDLHTEEQGKRLFPMIGIGASVGALAGSRIASAALGVVDVSELMLISAILLMVSGATALVIGRARPPVHKREAGEQKPKPDKEATSNGIALVARHRYLSLIAAFTLVFTFANTNGEYVLSVLMSDAAHVAVAAGEVDATGVREYIGQLYGKFYFWVNLVGVLIQAFLVSRLVKWGGIRLVLLVVPSIAIVTWLGALALPVLTVLWAGKTLENAADYSVNNTARQMLWLPTPSNWQYNAKQAVDTLFVRAGDVASAVLVFLGSTILALPLRGYAALNLVLIAAWILLALRIARRVQKGTIDG